MNLLDLALLFMLGYSAVRGFRQGALSQVAAFGGAILGLGIGATTAPPLASTFVEGPSAMLSLVTLGLLMVMIFVGQGVGFAIGLRLRAAAAVVGAAPVDRAAGIAVGLGGIVLAVWLLGGMLAQGPAQAVAQQVRESRVVAAIDSAMPPAPDIFARLGSYLDQHGFPQVFAGLGNGTTAPPVPPATEGAVASAQAAGAPSTVQVQSTGCNGISSGSGVVARTGFVVTNAHVVAGGEVLTVRDQTGLHDAVTILFDPGLDLAVLAAPSLGAPPLAWTPTPADREAQGAVLGFPGGQRQLAVKAATVRSRGEAVGRDIYGRGLVSREVLTLQSQVRRGDSGGPFVTAQGAIGGIVFAAAPADPDIGYALTAERVRPDVDEAMARNTSVPTGECRF